MIKLIECNFIFIHYQIVRKVLYQLFPASTILVQVFGSYYNYGQTTPYLCIGDISIPGSTISIHTLMSGVRRHCIAYVLWNRCTVQYVCQIYVTADNSTLISLAYSVLQSSYLETVYKLLWVTHSSLCSRQIVLCKELL